MKNLIGGVGAEKNDHIGKYEKREKMCSWTRYGLFQTDVDSVLASGASGAAGPLDFAPKKKNY